MTTRTVFLVGYLVIGVALMALVPWSGRAPSAVAGPAELARAATRRRAGRVVVLVAWWWVGFHVLARSG